MKKTILLIAGIILAMSSTVLAAETKVNMVADSVLKPKETKTAVISISNSDVEVGVVSGKIEKSDNITSIVVTGKNGWNLTYNKETGVFNIYKAEGSKAEEIINIEYTVSEQEGTAQITLNDLKATTIKYETTNLENITKEITIKAEEKTNNEEKNDTVSKEEQENDNTISKDDKTPQTGGVNIISVILAGMIIVSIISYISYKKYNNI